jgi:hypothetical protein
VFGGCDQPKEKTKVEFKESSRKSSGNGFSKVPGLIDYARKKMRSMAACAAALPLAAALE